ncbi:MAG: formyltetrahydrofolate deformylase [Candidatus Sumerlaeota bacterium]|nr:formyltetrahydrofolate deformylase [Candidatus Sumerlaeota bacterium]
MTRSRILAIVSVVGQDQKGVVARVSTYLAENNVNIEDIEQKVMQGMFIMNMLVDLSDLELPLDQMMSSLQKLGNEIKMDIEVRLLGPRKERKFVTFVTKEPHCLQRIFEDLDAGRFGGDLVAVWSNHDVLRGMAEERGVPFHHFAEKDREVRDAQILRKLDELQPDLIVLARYMQILSPAFVQRWRNKIINIHPSLLPYHPGPNAYRQAFETGRRVAGCTAHFVTEDLDEGPIILQDVFHINYGRDSLDDVKHRGQELEAKVLSKAIQLFLNNELLVKDNKVVFRPGLDFFKKSQTL